MKRILLPKKISFGRRKNERVVKIRSFAGRKKARNPRTSRDTRRGQQVLVFHSARGSISLSRSPFLSSNPHHSKLCTTKLLSSLSCSSPLNLPFAKKEKKKKIHPPTHHPHTEFNISSHSLLVCSGFNPAIIIPREQKDHPFCF